MSNKINVQKGKQGFQPTSKGKIAPTPGHNAKNFHTVTKKPNVLSQSLTDKTPNTLHITPAGEEGENDTMLTRVEIIKYFESQAKESLQFASSNPAGEYSTMFREDSIAYGEMAQKLKTIDSMSPDSSGEQPNIEKSDIVSWLEREGEAYYRLADTNPDNENVELWEMRAKAIYNSARKIDNWEE